MAFIERRHRDRLRGDRAAAQVRARGGHAWDQAKACIGATFDASMIHNDRKRAVEHFLKIGSRADATRARFANHARHLSRHNIVELDRACIYAATGYRIERADFEHKTQLGLTRPIRMPLIVWNELRLILRFLRAKKLHAQFPEILEHINGWPQRFSAAAE